LNKTSMGISFLKKKRFSPFERRFPYLLLWNFSDGTGWKIFRGAWNAWHKNSGYRGVCFLSVLSLLCDYALVRLTSLTPEGSNTAEISYTRLRNQQKSNPKSRNHERNQWILKSEITKTYMTAVTHRNQEIGLEIRKSG
jgi:hypothetical protein